MKPSVEPFVGALPPLDSGYEVQAHVPESRLSVLLGAWTWLVFWVGSVGGGGARWCQWFQIDFNTASAAGPVARDFCDMGISF